MRHRLVHPFPPVSSPSRRCFLSEALAKITVPAPADSYFRHFRDASRAASGLKDAGEASCVRRITSSPVNRIRITLDDVRFAISDFYRLGDSSVRIETDIDSGPVETSFDFVICC